MKFRPCIDIHQGKVKQIVGGSLKEDGSNVKQNFVSEQDASYYAALYAKHKQSGGHVILLDRPGSPFYGETKAQAVKALRTYPGGLQVGGGIRADNAKEFLSYGASHVIVTSYVFEESGINRQHLKEIFHTVGKEHLVLDLSCKRKENGYYIAVSHWSYTTNIKITIPLLRQLSDYCDEFLIHAVDVEGKAEGVETDLLEILGEWEGIPITYAGGIHNVDDLRKIKCAGKDKIDFTIGSALDLFGGSISYNCLTQHLV